MAVSKKELAANAARWMEVFKREGADKRGVGAIFLFFNRDDPEGSAVCVGSINKEGVAAACKGILKKIERDKSPIINPFENN